MDGTHGKDFVLTNYARNLIQVKARQLCRRREFLPADQADLQQELWLMLCERADAFDPVPAGKYLAVVTESEMKPKKAGSGNYPRRVPSFVSLRSHVKHIEVIT